MQKSGCHGHANGQEVTGIVTKPDFPSPMALMPFLNSVIGWENFAYDMYKYLGTSK